MVKPQRIAESLLRGKCGAAVLLDPRTGAVLTMASSPTYNPNLMEKPGGYAQIERTPAPCKPSAPFLNRATQGLYPPGSIFKTITAAAALDSGVYKPDSRFQDPGYCTQYGKRVYNAGNPDRNGPEAFGNLDLVTAFEHSVNAVFCQIGQKLGAGAGTHGGQAFRLLFGAAARDALRRALGVGGSTTSGRTSCSTRSILTQDVDPGRLAFGPGAHARHAAPDGDGRSRDRERRPSSCGRS